MGDAALAVQPDRAQGRGWRPRVVGLALAAWTGALLLLSLAVAPAAFDLLPREVAGRLMGRLFAIEAPISCVVAVLALVVQRRVQADESDQGRPASVLTIDVVLLAGVLFCTVAGYYGLQPAMELARLGSAMVGGLSFGALHGVSMGFFAAKLLVLAVLSWRAVR